MTLNVLPFLRGARLENTSEILAFCRNLRRKIVQSLKDCGWEEPIDQQAEVLASQVWQFIWEEAERGAVGMERQIDAGTLKSSEHNLRLTTPSGYIDSDGEIMVLLSLFDAWRSESEDLSPSPIKRKLKFTPYEALLAYAYARVNIHFESTVRIRGRAERRYFLSVSKEEAVKRCQTASEAWHFARHPLVIENSTGNAKERHSALLKHFTAANLELHMHLAAKVLIPDWEACVKKSEMEEENIDLKIVNPEEVETLILKCKPNTNINKRKANKIVRIHLENSIKKYARYLISRELSKDQQGIAQDKVIYKHESPEVNYKNASRKIREYIPALSDRIVRGLIRQDFSEIRDEKMSWGVRI